MFKSGHKVNLDQLCKMAALFTVPKKILNAIVGGKGLEVEGSVI